MDQIERKNIVTALSEYVTKMGSQAKAARSLRVSSALISQMVNGNWESIAEAMWLKVAAGCGYSAAVWSIVETRDLQMLTAIYRDAQLNGNVMAVTGSAGSGKTMAAKQYCKGNQTAYLLCCNEYWNKKMFLQELLAVMGAEWSGYSSGEMMQEVIRKIKSTPHPLIILDEADKLSDHVFYFFISIYNSLEDDLGTMRCGLILQATSFLQKRIIRGVKLNKKGYNEVYSRICRRFVELSGVSATDITMVCRANGITEKADIKEVIEDSEYDLRRVRRKIHSIKMLQERIEEKEGEVA